MFFLKHVNNTLVFPYLVWLHMTRRYFFCGSFVFFCLGFFYAFESVCLYVPCGHGLTFWLSFMVSSCEFVTFPLVPCVRCRTLLYRFLIFAPLLTFLTFNTTLPHNLIKENPTELTSCLTMNQNHDIKYCGKVYEMNGKNLF